MLGRAVLRGALIGLRVAAAELDDHAMSRDLIAALRILQDARPITLFERSTATEQPSLRSQAQWRRPGQDHHDRYLRLSGRTDGSRGAGTSPKQGGQEWSVVVLLLGRGRVILVDTASLSVQRTVLARLGQQRIGRGDMTDTLRTHARYDHMMNGALFTFATVAIGGAEKDPVLAAPIKTSPCTIVYVWALAQPQSRRVAPGADALHAITAPCHVPHHLDLVPDDGTCDPGGGRGHDPCRVAGGGRRPDSARDRRQRGHRAHPRSAARTARRDPRLWARPAAGERLRRRRLSRYPPRQHRGLVRHLAGQRPPH